MKTVKFNEFDICDNMKRAIEDMGFIDATPIQAKSIPYILNERDVIGQAQTGTGKTASFGIPILEMINPEDKSLQALVLCPTRELAIQVSKEIRKLGKYMHGIKALPVYGGQPIDRQIRALKKGVQIVIGTPGRIMDHMRRRTLKIDNVKTVVLDEADEMLNMGFRDDIESILKDTPDARQTVLFSATMPRAILDRAKKYQNNPKILKVVQKKLTVSNIEQYYFEVKNRKKLETLTRLIDIYNPKLSLVFCNTKRKVDQLADELQSKGYLVDAIHGDLKQRQRDRVMNSFRNGNLQILIATDVAARGIDVDDIEIVFNYDVPQDLEYYVHRIGRTGRAGRSGKAFTFAEGKEMKKLKNIQKYTKTKINKERTPSAKDVEKIKKEVLVEKLKDIIENENLSKEKYIVKKLFEENYSSLDIAAALLKINNKSEAEDENNNSSNNSFENTGAEEGMVRLFINIGRKQKIRPGDIVGAIAGETRISGDLIGNIDIYDKFSFVEVPIEYAKDVLNDMKNNRIKGNKINVEPANNR